MLESELKKLTVAVEANTAALLGSVAAGPIVAPVIAAEAVADAETATVPVPVVDIPLNDPVEEAVTLKQITEGIVALCKAKNREAAATLMVEYGAQKVPELKKHADKYGEILAKINALIEAK